MLNESVLNVVNSKTKTKISKLASCLGDIKLRKMFHKCFYNTLETTTEMQNDETCFVFTGDIPAMWLRDSSAQVEHYIPFAKDDYQLQKIIEGLIRRQVMYILIDPYANGFNKEANDAGHKDDLVDRSAWVWEKKYEVDSLCYPLRLAYKYWRETGVTHIFDEKFRLMLNSVIDVWEREQRHFEKSTYRFERLNCVDTDTLKNNGLGMPVNYTGMTWSGFRPSDDACRFGYLIPANMFAVVILGYVREIAKEVYCDDSLSGRSSSLQKQIQDGIENYGVYLHPKYGKIYAYETDGYGNYNLMDDANVPSLLSIPYIEYKPIDDLIYQNTRRFILSTENPYYFQGKMACGMGSQHTPNGHIWPIGLIMQALTSDNINEQKAIMRTLLDTDNNHMYMHESFHADNPAIYTRSWFAWANSLFAELIMKMCL